MMAEGSEWCAIEGSEATTLEDELRREMPVGHALHGREVYAVARRDDRDDVAFYDFTRRGR